ncbi:hypothetical protein VNO77_22663 [Canavalia gladiata]|uniref:Uncharacterized protein n=1 Tax=Canavalia gladiata TaxID=3824 RepID=A0AAN9L5M0_CANGL
MMRPLFYTTITNVKLATQGRLDVINVVLISSVVVSTLNAQLGGRGAPGGTIQWNVQSLNRKHQTFNAMDLSCMGVNSDHIDLKVVVVVGLTVAEITGNVVSVAEGISQHGVQLPCRQDDPLTMLMNGCYLHHQLKSTLVWKCMAAMSFASCFTLRSVTYSGRVCHLEETISVCLEIVFFGDERAETYGFEFLLRRNQRCGLVASLVIRYVWVLGSNPTCDVLLNFDFIC